MATTTLSSRDFNQDTGRAKQAARKGPVVITDRGRPSHVLLTYGDYEKLLGRGTSLLDAIAQQEGGDFHFDPPRVEGLSKPADLDA
ncbi:type II toxin-antitoxin system Phd/YefM family antitoxin [Aquabacterium humicola]|uniref:type II toxin-antitoxin system Phd/YefM family antitoxin n=1 Tax=Aquabacterium humicola TaxID=3237377 RepID=UPI002542D81F|nr:type II toxin-antitoxin system Phd/YefM family antitoxin [Rubrivivax pictus]